MGISYNTTIVRSGLVLHLDAANPKSYSGSGTVWKDLSGLGNNGTLTNGVGYSNGTMSFDGINDYVNTTVNYALNDFTVCAWFKNINSTGYARIVDKSYANGFWFGRNNQNGQWGGGVRQTSGYNYITLSEGVWHLLTMRRTGTSLTVYGDNTSISNTTTCGSGALDNTLLSIGGTVNDGGGQRDWYNGYIGQVLLYNRALSAAEVKQNFEALRGRYGV